MEIQRIFVLFSRKDTDQLPHFSNDTIAILIYDRPRQLISLFVFHKHDRAVRTTMYIYYILRGTQAGNAVELEGDIDEEGLTSVDVDNGPAIVEFLAHKVNQEGR